MKEIISWQTDKNRFGNSKGDGYKLNKYPTEIKDLIIKEAPGSTFCSSKLDKFTKIISYY